MPIVPSEASVIVVDDDSNNLYIAIELLRAKVKVRYYNGRASGHQLFILLETLSDMRLDLILLDLQLPNEDGYTVLKQLRQLPELKQTLIVAFTANVMPSELERARAAGFDGFIGKPINSTAFPELIRRILAGEQVWASRS